MPRKIGELATGRERKRIAKALHDSGRTTEAQKFKQGDQVDDEKIRVALYEQDHELLRELRRRFEQQAGANFR